MPVMRRSGGSLYIWCQLWSGLHPPWQALEVASEAVYQHWEVICKRYPTRHTPQDNAYMYTCMVSQTVWFLKIETGSFCPKRSQLLQQQIKKLGQNMRMKRRREKLHRSRAFPRKLQDRTQKCKFFAHGPSFDRPNILCPSFEHRYHPLNSKK